MVEFFLCFWDFTCFSGLELDSLGLGVPVVPLLGVRGPQTKPPARLHQGLLGGSWVDISGVISPLSKVISIVTLFITLLITTHEPPSRGQGFRGGHNDNDECCYSSCRCYSCVSGYCSICPKP